MLLINDLNNFESSIHRHLLLGNEGCTLHNVVQIVGPLHCVLRRELLFCLLVVSNHSILVGFDGFLPIPQ